MYYLASFAQMCCHNVVRSSKECLCFLLFACSTLEMLCTNTASIVIMSRQEFFKCYRFLLHVFWVYFFPFYFYRAHSITYFVIPTPTCRAISIKSLRVFERDYNDRFFIFLFLFSSSFYLSCCCVAAAAAAVVRRYFFFRR